VTITLSQATTAVNEALGATDTGPASLTADVMVQQAGRALFNMHGWRFRERTAALDTVADQEYVALPADFGQLITLRTATGGGVEWTGMARMHELRSFAGAGSVITNVAIAFTVVSGVPTPRLELYPTPAADSSPGLRLEYRASYQHPAESSDAMPVPAYVEPLLLEVLRAVAFAYDEDEAPSEGLSVRLAAIRSGPVFMAAKAQDGDVQPELTGWRGGIGECFGWDEDVYVSTDLIDGTTL
jgi:hypothetical protein